MSVQFASPTGPVNLVAATPKTILEIGQGANIPGELIQLAVSSTYVTAATPVSLLVELGTATATGTGTAVTPRRIGTAQGTALDTVKVNHTAEPAGFVAFDQEVLILPGGPLPWQYPLGRELFLPVSGFFVVRLTASAACTVYATAYHEV